MITLIFNAISGFLGFLIGFFPTGTPFDSSVHSAFSLLGGYFGLMDVFVPVSTVVYCLLLVYGTQIGLFAFKSVKWIISHIPLVGGKGNE